MYAIYSNLYYTLYTTLGRQCEAYYGGDQTVRYQEDQVYIITQLLYNYNLYVCDYCACDC